MISKFDTYSHDDQQNCNIAKRTKKNVFLKITKVCKYAQGNLWIQRKTRSSLPVEIKIVTDPCDAGTVSVYLARNIETNPSSGSLK